MKLIIESTSKIVEVNGVPARIWEGITSTAIPVHCYIARVAVKEGMDPAVYAQFENELKETKAPSPEIQAIPLRLIL
jgi:hypothetical protein